MKRNQDSQQRAELKKTLQTVRENHRLTVRSIAGQANINRETIREILTEDLDMRKVCAKMVPKELTEEHSTVREFLASRQITVLGHPPNSPDLAPNDFFLFPKIKEILKGGHFDDIDDMSNTVAALKAIPQNQFQNCFEGWTRWWQQCIASHGVYFEGDHNDIQQ
jgi:hypothetical protein